MKLTQNVCFDRGIPEQDTLELKNALRRLGHYQTPKYGMTPYPDQGMFDGIKAFQKQMGISPTGAMRKDGPEHQAIAQQLAQLDADEQKTQQWPGIDYRPPLKHDLSGYDSPVPNGQLRKPDAYGKGHFGASRGRRTHEGVDIVVQPEDKLLSPTNGKVKRIFRPYSPNNPQKAPYRGVEIEGNDGYTTQIMYVKPSIKPGAVLKKGDPIGTSQDLRSAYPGITPHTHMGIWKGRPRDNNVANPTQIFKRGK